MGSKRWRQTPLGLHARVFLWRRRPACPSSFQAEQISDRSTTDDRSTHAPTLPQPSLPPMPNDGAGRGLHGCSRRSDTSRRGGVVAEKGSGVVLYSALLMLLIRFRRELLLRQCYRRPRRSDRFPRGFRIRCYLISGGTHSWNQEVTVSASLGGVSEKFLENLS